MLGLFCFYATPPGGGEGTGSERSHVVLCLRGGLRGSGYGAVALHVVARAAVRLRQRVHQRLVDILFLRGGLRRRGHFTPSPLDTLRDGWRAARDQPSVFQVSGWPHVGLHQHSQRLSCSSIARLDS